MSEEKKQDQQEEADVAVEVEDSIDSPEETDVGEEQISQEDPEEELVRARQEVDELRDKMLRMAADTENFKKRMERERHTMLAYAGENIFREILPVVDNLERALSAGMAEGVASEESLASLLEGVQLTLKSLLATLEKFEVKPIESVGQPFNPQYQEALTMDASDEIPENHVVTEFERGYFFKERLLRAANGVGSSGKREKKNEE